MIQVAIFFYFSVLFILGVYNVNLPNCSYYMRGKEYSNLHPSALIWWMLLFSAEGELVLDLSMTQQLTSYNLCNNSGCLDQSC